MNYWLSKRHALTLYSGPYEVFPLGVFRYVIHICLLLMTLKEIKNWAQRLNKNRLQLFYKKYGRITYCLQPLLALTTFNLVLYYI